MKLFKESTSRHTFCSALVSSLSLSDVLFSRFLCELEGKKLIFASALSSLCISATPRAGTLERACCFGRLGAPSPQVLCAHWDGSTNWARFLTVFFCFVPSTASVVWERFTAQQLPGANRLFPLSAAQEGFPGLGADSLALPRSQHCSCVVFENPPFVPLLLCPAQAPRWCQRDADAFQAGVTACAWPREARQLLQCCTPTARKHQACGVSGWDTPPRVYGV